MSGSQKDEGELWCGF